MPGGTSGTTRSQRGAGRLPRRPARRDVLAVATLITFALALGACGGDGGSNNATVVEAGQLGVKTPSEYDVKLPPGYKMVDGKVVPPKGAKLASNGSGASTAAAAADGSTATTIPLDTKQDPTTALFTALKDFRSCLDGLGVQFVGAPDQSNPNSPTNDPAYLDALRTCAARSNIVQALQASREAQAKASPEEIEKQNKGYLKWRSCMIDRGWKIAKPVPDAQGRLFSFGGGGGSGGQNQQSQIQAPPGKDILSSNDTSECAAVSQKAVGK